MGGVSSMYGKQIDAHRVLVGKYEESTLQDPGVNGRTMYALKQ